MSKKTRNSGFTLVELMVVMAIIAILATASVASYSNYIKKARDTSALAEMQEMYNTIQLINLNKRGYPAATTINADLLANSGKKFKHPGKAKCLTGVNIPVACVYTYQQCDAGRGFLLSTNLENDVAQYGKDVITGKYATGGINGNSPAPTPTPDTFVLGNCNAVTAGAADVDGAD